MPLARFALLLLALAFLPRAAPAQDAAPIKPLTLAAALAAVKPPEGEVVMVVAAEKTPLPPGAAPPVAGASLNETAAAFGRITQDFGDVMVVAPPTMTLLNAAPGTPNIYTDLPQGDALKMLAATLSSTQWKMMTSAQGIGQDDLTADFQRSLFLAQFPGGVLHVAPEHTILSPPGQVSRDLSADLPRARLRLRREVMLMLPSPEHENSFYNIFEPDDPTHKRYELEIGEAPKDTLYGVQSRQKAPNALKAGELDYDQSILRKTVALDGVKTVGDLVGRVGAECRLELYADRRYESKTITLAGVRTAPARRLLQALAFCLTGTFRRVGPAYVLTDDVLGLGTRRQIWAEFERQAEELRRKPLDAAGDALITAHSPDDLSTSADPLALSPAQAKQARQESPMGYGPGLQLPFSALTPAQQQAARQKIALFNQYRDHYKWLKDGETVSLDGKLSLEASPKLELIVPLLAEPVAMNNGPSLQELFRPSSEMQNKMREARAAEPATAAPIAPKPSPAPPLARLLRTIPHRVVLAQLQTPADVDVLVASMKTVGLNELWLDVFSGGVCRVPVPSGAIQAGITPPPPDASDVLAEAVRATRGSGIRVFAALDLLAWGAKTPASIQERTILGETGKEAGARQGAQAPPFPEASGPTAVAVSPFAPPVQAALRSLVQSLASRPGLAGIVWRETAPSGYEKAGDGQQGPEFGYGGDARLSFLRRAHMDPLDVPLRNEGQANTSLPEFEGGTEGAKLSEEWDKFRLDGDVVFLRGLADLWASHGARRPILIRQRRQTWGDDWFGSWDGPAKPLPAHHSSWEIMDSGPTYPEASDAQAKTTSQTALLRLSSGFSFSPDVLAEELTRSLVGKRWDGFVLDLTPDARPGDPLAGLTPKPASAAK